MIVQACAQADFDVATGTCAAPIWMDFPGLLPPLSVEDGLVLSGAMITVVATARAMSMLRRFIAPKL